MNVERMAKITSGEIEIGSPLDFAAAKLAGVTVKELYRMRRNKRMVFMKQAWANYKAGKQG